MWWSQIRNGCAINQVDERRSANLRKLTIMLDLQKKYDMQNINYIENESLVHKVKKLSRKVRVSALRHRFRCQTLLRQTLKRDAKYWAVRTSIGVRGPCQISGEHSEHGTEYAPNGLDVKCKQKRWWAIRAVFDAQTYRHDTRLWGSIDAHPVSERNTKILKSSITELRVDFTRGAPNIGWRSASTSHQSSGR